MTPEEYEAAGRIYREAKGLEPAERSAFLERACGDAERLRSIVDAWLATDTSTGDVGVVPGASAPAPLPARIGEFDVLELLGVGGMGRVYLARQDSPARQVAIKTLDPDAPVSRRAIARFEAEAEYLARLRHGGIAQVYSTGRLGVEQGRMPYLVMEWIEGGRSLTEYANAAGLDLDERIALFLRLCEAISHAHQRGVIHRDLKPSNILVTPEGEVKVLDFGVARALEPELAAADGLTRRGEAIGTLPYMSPEQALGRTDEIDVRTDVYALGVILFELAAGRLPLELPADRHGAVERIATALPPRLNAVRRDVPRDLAAVVDAALAKEKERRYDSVTAFADDIRCVVEGRPVSTRPVSTWERGVYFVRRRKAAAAALTALVVGLVVSVYFGVTATVANRTASALEVNKVFQIAQSYARVGKWTPAMDAYRDALDDGYPDPVEIQLAQVEALEGMGDVRAARQVIDELSALPDDAIGRHLARLLLFRADTTKVPESRFAPFQGHDLLERALDLGTLSQADLSYAVALASANAHDQLRHLADALRHDSYHRRANEMYAPTLLVSGHPREAMAAAAEFRRLFPDDPAAQTIQLGVQALIDLELPADPKRSHPAVPEEVIPTLEKLVAVIRLQRKASAFLARELQMALFGQEPTRGIERLGFLAEALAPLNDPRDKLLSGAFEAMFRVPPGLSEAWLRTLTGFGKTMLGAGGSADEIGALSGLIAHNDDAFLVYARGVHRLLVNPEDPAYWTDFAMAAERDSWIDIRKPSLVLIVAASLRHRGKVPTPDVERSIDRLIHELHPEPLDFRFVWHACRELELDDLRVEVFRRWRRLYPDDPALVEATEQEAEARRSS